MSLRHSANKSDVNGMSDGVGITGRESEAASAPTGVGPLQRKYRRLVVLFDGTGNTRQSLTNVARMFEAIDDSTASSYKPAEELDPETREFREPVDEKREPKLNAYTKMGPCKSCRQPVFHEPKDDRDHNWKDVAGVPCDACNQLVVEPEQVPDQLVKYIKGVGTNFFGRKLSQWLGYGLSANIMTGYEWLSKNYREGDEIFVFGFSRGAFSARSLVSLLHTCHGVLKKTTSSDVPISRDVVNAAYGLYRKCKDTGQILKKEKFETEFYASCDKLKKGANPLLAARDRFKFVSVRVKMLGVWDTVGALGIPRTYIFPCIDNSDICRTQYKFHDQGLSCIVDNAYHALALDEHRKDFAPQLWDKTVRATNNERQPEVKQVWFAGSHCNVGGGADLDDNDDPDDLWQYSYVWMQKHAEKHGLRFYWSYDTPATRLVRPYVRSRRVSLRDPEKSYENFVYGIYKYLSSEFHRDASPNLEVAATGNVLTHSAELARLHWSVVERIRATEQDFVSQHHLSATPEPAFKLYRPPSLFGKAYDPKTSQSKETEKTEYTVAKDSESVDLHQFDKDGKEISKTTWLVETDDVWPCGTEWKLDQVPCRCEDPPEVAAYSLLQPLEVFKQIFDYIPSVLTGSTVVPDPENENHEH